MIHGDNWCLEIPQLSGGGATKAIDKDATKRDFMIEIGYGRQPFPYLRYPANDSGIAVLLGSFFNGPKNFVVEIFIILDVFRK